MGDTDAEACQRIIGSCRVSPASGPETSDCESGTIRRSPVSQSANTLKLVSIRRRDLILFQLSVRHFVGPGAQDFLRESDDVHAQSHPAAGFISVSPVGTQY